MKRLIFSVVILFFVFSSVFAHAPETVDITVSDKVIGVNIRHPVSNPKRHYVRKVEVILNGKKIIEQTFALQIGNRQELVYHIPSLKRSDVLTVEAFCNIGGSQKKTIIVH